MLKFDFVEEWPLSIMSFSYMFVFLLQSPDLLIVFNFTDYK